MWEIKIDLVTEIMRSATPCSSLINLLPDISSLSVHFICALSMIQLLKSCCSHRDFNPCTQSQSFLSPPTTCSPLTVGHLHGLQLGVRPSVEAFHLLLLQSFQQTDGVLVDATSLRQHQRGGSIVVTMMQDNQQSAVRPNT